MAENTATPVPQHSGARASREYAQRAAPAAMPTSPTP